MLINVTEYWTHAQGSLYWDSSPVSTSFSIHGSMVSVKSVVGMMNQKKRFNSSLSKIKGIEKGVKLQRQVQMVSLNSNWKKRRKGHISEWWRGRNGEYENENKWRWALHMVFILIGHGFYLDSFRLKLSGIELSLSAPCILLEINQSVWRRIRCGHFYIPIKKI